MVPTVLVLYFLCVSYIFTICLGKENCSVVLPDEKNPIESNIIGGKAPNNTLATYMVALLSSKGNLCTGSLISSQWVLTAAHCNLKLGDKAIIGARSLDEESKVVMNIEQVISHPDFLKEDLSFRKILDDDIAVVKLEASLQGNYSTMLINTNTDQPMGGKYLRVAGYGLTEGDTAGTLYQVDVPHKSSARCLWLYITSGNFVTGIKIKDGLQFCAGYEDGQCDSCAGDSGGPIYTLDSADRPVQVGITSFGIGCARKRLPGVYVRVSAYIDWLRS